MGADAEYSALHADNVLITQEIAPGTTTRVLILAMRRRFTAPRRGDGSLQGKELLGVVTSHPMGPPDSPTTSSQKSSGASAETPGMAAAAAAREMPVLSVLFQVRFSEWVSSVKRYGI